MGRRPTTSGFSLVELMVTMIVLAVLAAIAFPSFQQTIRSTRLASTTNEVIGALMLSRTEAIRNTRGSQVCPSSDGLACTAGTNWSGGWIVWWDANGNGAVDSSEVISFARGNPNMVVTGPGAPVQFDGRGRANAAVALILRPKECGGQPLQRRLELSQIGQIRKEGALEGCT